MTNQEACKLVNAFIVAKMRLENYRNEIFPIGSRARVECESYTGVGDVCFDDECPIHQVPVKLERGNVFWFPIENCTPALP
jgi:hypothetical protein